MGTKIEWTSETWNPIVGCTKISSGCKECYAEKFAKRLVNNPNPKISNKYMNVISPDGWTNKTHLEESVLNEPFYWKKSRMIFVCSMGDLFHESVPFEWIDKVITVIALNPQHIFQVLTKRPERMKEYFDNRECLDDWINEISYNFDELDYNNLPENWINDTTYVDDMYGDVISDNELRYDGELPLSNLWLGVTCESENYICRIHELLKIPAKIHFVSFEPLLSGICIPQGMIDKDRYFELGTIDWIIAGTETGLRKRPCKKEWIKSLYEQCKVANVPFFDKKNILGKNIQQYPI